MYTGSAALGWKRFQDPSWSVNDAVGEDQCFSGVCWKGRYCCFPASKRADPSLDLERGKTELLGLQLACWTCIYIPSSKLRCEVGFYGWFSGWQRLEAVIGTICANFVSNFPPARLACVSFLILFFLLFLFFQFRGTELRFHILVKDQGCDLFWVEAGGESTGKEVIIGLRFKKINKLSGTAVEPSNSISLHTKFSKMEEKNSSISKPHSNSFFLPQVFLSFLSLCLLRRGTRSLRLPWVPALKTVSFI